jgi:SAM-dependent methyltransferase
MTDQAQAVAAAIPAARAFNKEVAPAFIDHVCITSGYAPPPGSPVGEAMGASFTYCELHAASAVTTTLLASCNPMGDFHGIDPRAEMIEKGRDLAADGKAKNITFHQAGIEAALELDLPQFDYVVVHGVYSWVPLRERALVLAFLRKFLKPGGAVYVTYNARPGAAQLEPFRRLFREMPSADTSKRLTAARDVYKRLADAKARAVASGIAPDKLARLAELPPDAIGADYANPFADALYVTEVISDFASIDCVLGGAADMAQQASVLMAHEPFKSILDRMPTAAGRELAKDYLLDTAYRRDVFVRGGRRLAADNREAVLGGLAFALEQPAGTVRYDKRMPFGEMKFDNPQAHALVAALAEGPRTLGALIEQALTSGADAGAVAANVHALLLTDQIRPVYRPTKEAVDGARAMATAVRARVLSADPIGFLPSGTGTAFLVPVPDQLFMEAGRAKDTDALIAHAVQRIEQTGQTANRDALEKRARVFARMSKHYGSLLLS